MRVLSMGWMSTASGLATLVLCAGSLCAGSLVGQCALQPSATQPGGSDGEVCAIAASGASEVFFAGEFTTIGGIAASGVARFDGSIMQPLGDGLTEQPSWAILDGAGAQDAIVTRSGDLVVGGQFVRAGGVVCNSIARWDGNSWSAMGSGANNYVYALVELPNGDLVAAGSFTTMDGVAANCIARWDGVEWATFGTGFTGGLIGTSVTDLAVAPNGDLIAVGGFSNVDGVPALGVARWDGANWTFPGSGFSGPVFGGGLVEALPSGDFVVAGLLSIGGNLHYIARFDGVAWTAIDVAGQLWPRSLHVLPNGDLVAQGQFQATGTPTPMGRFDGANWTAFGGVTDGRVLAIEHSDSGKLWLGGLFGIAAGVAEPGLVQLETPCVAAVESFGPWCSSSGGNNELVAKSQPWAGAVFQAEATGLPEQALAATLIGFESDCQFLTALLTLADPGCFLLVRPDLVALQVVDGGRLATETALPNSSSLSGLDLYHQVLPFETDAAGSWVTTTATNALRLTVGAF